MTNISKSKGKTPSRFSNRKRARRSNPDVESMESHDGEVFHSLRMKKSNPQIVEISSRNLFYDLRDTRSHEEIQKERGSSGKGIRNSGNAAVEKFVSEKVPDNSIEERVTNIEKMVDKVVMSIDNISQNPKDETEMILAKLSKGEFGTQNRMVLVTTATPSGYYINPRNADDKSELLVGEYVPRALRDIFKPLNPIGPSKSEAAIASYIFCKELVEDIDKKEIIVATELKYCDGNRRLLQTLKPKNEIEQDVINLSVCMLTLREKSGGKYSAYWFMPTTFSQFVLSWNAPTMQMIDYYFDSFMGKVDLVSKEVVYLDSFPGDERKEKRMRSVHTMAQYMETLLQHNSFYDFAGLEKPQVSKFPIFHPQGIITQNVDSNDCGVWVILWLIEMGINGYRIKVDEGTRLRIALDLALNPSNTVQEVIM
ncbi:Ulp1 protease family, C-terminal catalytic domain [Sesbania bispinosa]|nr:Ulp1 protease family, C-terminal catalytic domain [Sesbania bispinosa]